MSSTDEPEGVINMSEHEVSTLTATPALSLPDEISKTQVKVLTDLKQKIKAFRQIIHIQYDKFDNTSINPRSSQTEISFALKKPLNASDVIEKLAEAENLLMKVGGDDDSNLIKAEKLFYDARHAWHKAIISSNSNTLGYMVIAVELLYLVMILVGYFLYKNSLEHLSYAEFEIKIAHESFLQVPIVVYVWGFIGGATWCAYSACYWMKRRMFDRAYIVWYVLHPFVSSFLGAIAAVLILGGIETFSRPELNSNINNLAALNLSRPLVYLLILTSFVAGFSANNIWKTLDSYVKKILGERLDPENKML